MWRRSVDMVYFAWLYYYRDFHLSLVHNDGIFSSDFGAHIVGKDGQPRQVHLDKHEFYHGHVHGEDTKHYALIV